METLYEEGYSNGNKSNVMKKLSVPNSFEPARTPSGRRRSATATLRNGSEIILEVPEEVDERNTRTHEGNCTTCYDGGDVDDIQLGGEAMITDTAAGGLEIPSWSTPRASLGGGPSSSYGSRCGSTTSFGSNSSSAISWTDLQALRRTAAAASQAAVLSYPNNCDPNSIASLSRVGSGCFTSDLYSAAMCLG